MTDHHVDNHSPWRHIELNDVLLGRVIPANWAADWLLGHAIEIPRRDHPINVRVGVPLIANCWISNHHYNATRDG